MAKDFTVTVYGERGEEFEKLFGTRTVNVRSPFPVLANLGGNPVPESVYMLDLELLTNEQRAKLVQHIAEKFSANPSDVSHFLDEEGLPIKASDTVVTVTNPQKWLLDDEPFDKNDTHEFDVMSDLDDDEVEEFDGFDEF